MRVLDPNTFTGAELDRAADHRRRDVGWLAAQSADPQARAVVFGDAGLKGTRNGLERVALADLPPGAVPVLLGLDAEGPLFAVDEDPPTGHDRPAPMVGAGGRRGEAPPTAPGRLGLREAADALPQAEGGLAAYAAGLLNWHRRHGFCPNCGGPTHPGEGGLTRRCSHCGESHHPRVDPVVIMLVVDGPERVLLGRQPTWPAGRYSALAGFVGPGESLEEAVTREVAEEAGVRVGCPEYVSSQPWPFPASLMLGFRVPWEAGDPAPADDELQDVRWFEREEVVAAAARDADRWEAGSGERLGLPPRSAIARRLIEAWLLV